MADVLRFLDQIGAGPARGEWQKVETLWCPRWHGFAALTRERRYYTESSKAVICEPISRRWRFRGWGSSKPRETVLAEGEWERYTEGEG